jgi:hypothetical protein
MTAPTPDEQRYHWTEGNKFALEAMKSLLWLNGASAAALLTVFGGTHQHPISPDSKYAILSFAIGAAFSVFMFIWAYGAQLHFGHYGILKKWGQLINYGSYLAMLVPLIGFLCGLRYAYGAVTAVLGTA